METGTASGRHPSFVEHFSGMGLSSVRHTGGRAFLWSCSASCSRCWEAEAEFLRKPTSGDLRNLTDLSNLAVSGRGVQSWFLVSPVSSTLSALSGPAETFGSLPSLSAFQCFLFRPASNVTYRHCLCIHRLRTQWPILGLNFLFHCDIGNGSGISALFFLWSFVL